jgi:hypothetical protein
MSSARAPGTWAPSISTPTLGHRRHRQDQRRLRRDVVEDREARARRQRGRHGVGGRRRRVALRGPRRRHRDDLGAHRARHEPGRHHDRAVGLVEHDDLVARLQRERAQHRVDAGARVVDEHEVVAARADERADGVRRPAQQRTRRTGLVRRHAHQLAKQEAGRLRLDAALPGVLRLQHHARRRAHGAVVQVGDLGIQPPVAEEGAAEGGHGRVGLRAGRGARLSRRPRKGVGERPDRPAAFSAGR